MQIHYGLNQFKAVRPVVTIGTFDGVHRGHREVLAELQRLSAEIGGESVVFTFDPHPRLVLAPQENTLRLLSTLEEKIALMEQCGINHLVIYPFTEAFSKLTYDEFVSQVLVDQIHIESLVVGYDHRFGQGRKGDFNSLSGLAQKLHFKVEQLSRLVVDQLVVSSSKIRAALEGGDVLSANHLLGYPYTLSGCVVRGEQLGRKLGYPTANLDPHNPYKQIPADGVYAVWVSVAGKRYGGMLNIGYRPTVNHHEHLRTIETNIFDFDEDIYDSEITLSFVARIRAEQKFSGIDSLILQLAEDKRTTQRILEENNL